jgi:hypothetical protein
MDLDRLEVAVFYFGLDFFAFVLVHGRWV